MRFLLSIVFSVFILLSISTGIVLSQPMDLDAGSQVFSQNCSACHAGGNNSVNPAKTLKIDDLSKYGKDSIEKIVYQVRNGAGAMPAFDDLSDEEVFNVAKFVLSQSRSDSW
uniref:Cytochrome c553 n=1 Tax=Herposiphonia versicolor TaxID=2007163 RepID=A0A1Z1MG09_9FLOR|nr:cytochrome c553 [Herposiphonia versicolor]ARW64684.1 cytochrome c553 [Herposiphonia versicolor]